MNQRALIFLSIYILALFCPLLKMVDFTINQERITEEFCENKDKPQLKCHGKCYLSKILAEQLEAEDNSLLPDISKEDPIGKVEPVFVISPNDSDFFLTPPPYIKYAKSAYLKVIDNPPEISDSKYYS